MNEERRKRRGERHPRDHGEQIPLQGSLMHVRAPPTASIPEGEKRDERREEREEIREKPAGSWGIKAKSEVGSKAWCEVRKEKREVSKEK